MKKFLLVSSLAILSFFLFFACSKKEEKTDSNTSTDAKKEDNSQVFEDIGFKVNFPKELSDPDANITIDGLGDDADPKEPILGGYLYQYVSDATKQDIDKIVNDTTLSREEIYSRLDNEVYTRIKDIFALVTFRANLIEDESQMKEILGIDDIKVVRKTDKYIQILAFTNGSDVENLTDEEQKQYKGLLDLAKSLSASVEAIDPKPKAEALQSITALTFKTQDLEGNEVTSDIFNKADVTMVNIWATWCAPCKAELPDIGRVAKKYKEKGGQVIAICSDVTEEDDSTLDEAKEIIADSECDFVVLKNHSSLDSIFKNIQAYPTTLFFDKNGNLIGNVIIGGRSESDFEALFEEMLEKVK